MAYPPYLDVDIDKDMMYKDTTSPAMSQKRWDLVSCFSSGVSPKA